MGSPGHFITTRVCERHETVDKGTQIKGTRKLCSKNGLFRRNFKKYHRERHKGVYIMVTIKFIV